MPRNWRQSAPTPGPQSDAVNVSDQGLRSPHPSRLRSGLSLLVVAFVIGLTALSFHTLAVGRTPVRSSSMKVGAAPQTSHMATGPKNQWVSSATLGASGVPIVAPSNPAVFYQLAAPATTLRRSADHSRTWQTSALPARLASQVALYVSPLDANTVFLSARYAHPPQDGAQCVEAPEHTPLAAGYECVAQWVSVDGGAHWVTPRLPLGAPLTDLSPVFWAGGPEFVQAQGQVLFGALYCHEPLCGNTGYRVVRSVDGGLTWQFADANIAAAHQYVCDVAPVTHGTTLFAVSAPISCTTALDQSAFGGGYDAFHLWRSDDSAQQWSLVGGLPVAVGGHLLVEPSPTAGAQPLLYGATFASADGGNTWHAAPHVGLPAGARTQVIGVRQDGSLVVGVIPPPSSSTGQPVTETIYCWRAGDASWQQVGQRLPGAVANFTATQDTTGQETLWVAIPMGPFSSGSSGQLATPSSYQIESLLD